MDNSWNPWKKINKGLTSIPRQLGWIANPPLSILGLVGIHVQLPDSNSLFTSPYAGGQELTGSPSPNKYTTLYNAAGKRMVFYRGSWTQDDLSNPIDNWMARTNSSLQSEPYHPNYSYMDYQGNYLDYHTGKVIPKGTAEWFQAKWGDTLPDSELEAHPSEAFDPTPDETITLDYYVQQARAINNPGLVKIGKAINPGDTFYVNGQRAIMGSPDAQGQMQYATSQGEGDRWKYKVSKDAQGNWVRMYYRTFGAKKEKAMRFKKKHKD
jgi:hypothetical protein